MEAIIQMLPLLCTISGWILLAFGFIGACKLISDGLMDLKRTGLTKIKRQSVRSLKPLEWSLAILLLVVGLADLRYTRNSISLELAYSQLAGGFLAILLSTSLAFQALKDAAQIGKDHSPDHQVILPKVRLAAAATLAVVILFLGSVSMLTGLHVLRLISH